jgi:hypothetical protein
VNTIVQWTLLVIWCLSNGPAHAEGLPDILGIQLGMPAREAHAKLQAQLPKNKIQVMSEILPTIDKPVIRSFLSAPAETITTGMEADQVTLDVTLPPNKQSVWRVVRQHYFPNKGIARTTLVASLREKYGKETLTNVAQGKPAQNDSQITSLLWFFDEQGQPAPLPGLPGSKAPNLSTTLTLSSCMSGQESMQLNLIEVYADLYKGQNPQNDWCNQSFTAVVVGLTESNLPELISQMQIVSISRPLALRASEVSMKWKKELAEGQHRQDLEKAKQQEKPKL